MWNKCIKTFNYIQLSLGLVLPIYNLSTKDAEAGKLMLEASMGWIVRPVNEIKLIELKEYGSEKGNRKKGGTSKF